MGWTGGGERLGPCPVCGRQMVAGPSVDRHHLVPKSEGGRETVWLHRICHRKLHSLWSESHIARAYADPAVIRAHPEIQTFVRWVARKHPEFYGRTATARVKRGRRGK